MRLSHNKTNLPLARELRKNMTPWERKLWYEFLSTYPVRFRRQAPIGNYIVDFYCAKAKLVIELDGGQHYSKEGREGDAQRDRYLQDLGLTVLRYSNLDVDRNFEGVCQDIDRSVKLRLPPSVTAVP